jgi:hypothetical protein
MHVKNEKCVKKNFVLQIEGKKKHGRPRSKEKVILKLN